MVTNNDFYPGLKKNKDFFDGEEEFNTVSIDQSAIFLTSNFLYLIAVISFSISKPFKKRFYTNIWFTLNLFILYIYAIIISFVPKSRFLDFEIDEILEDQNGTKGTENWLLYIVLWSNFWCILIYLFEELIAGTLVSYFINKKNEKKTSIKN